MPQMRLVVKDAEKANAARRRQMADAYRRAGYRPQDIDALVAREGVVDTGAVWAELATECPEGRPNCDRCGDPAHADACQAAGHCADCGTKHGIAPLSVLEAHGLEKVAV
jgi:hypothetical protein